MDKKKIIFFLSPYCGGAEKMSINISKMLDKKICEVEYVVLGCNIEEIQEFIPKGSKLHFIHIRNIWDFTTFRLVRFLKQSKPTCIFSSLVYMNVRLILAARLVGGIGIVVRNDNNWDFHRWDNRLFMRFTYPMANWIIAQQEEMADQLIKHIPGIKDKVKTLHNPVDYKLVDEHLKEINPYKSNNEIKYIWVGRIHPTKGQDVLLKAYNIVHNKVHNAHLYILGKIDENNSFYQSLVTYAHDNNLLDYCHFVGFQANPHVWEKYADVFVMPSRTEGLPNALLEAMYIGKPVVATSCIPVVERIVDDGYNGFVVPSEDSELMAQRMLDALKLKDFKMTYRAASQQDFIRLFENINDKYK